MLTPPPKKKKRNQQSRTGTSGNSTRVRTRVQKGTSASADSTEADGPDAPTAEAGANATTDDAAAEVVEVTADMVTKEEIARFEQDATGQCLLNEASMQELVAKKGREVIVKGSMYPEEKLPPSYGGWRTILRKVRVSCACAVRKRPLHLRCASLE